MAFKWDEKRKIWVEDKAANEKAARQMRLYGKTDVSYKGATSTPKSSASSKKSGAQKSSTDVVDPIKTATQSSYTDKQKKPTSTAKSAAVKSSVYSSTNKPIDPELDSFEKSTNTQSSVIDAAAMTKDLPGYIETFKKEMYKPGGSFAIKDSGADMGIRKVAYLSPIWEENIANGQQYLPMSDEDYDALLKDVGAIKDETNYWVDFVRARTGDASVLEGKKGKEKQKLQGAYNLYGFDQVPGQLAKQLPKFAQREGINTYQDLYNKQLAYSRDQMEKDLKTIDSFYNARYAMPGMRFDAEAEQEFADAVSRYEEYSGVDLTNMPADYDGKWIKRMMSSYDADTDMLRGVVEGSEGNWDFDDVYNRDKALLDEQRQKEQADAKGKKFEAEAGEMEAAVQNTEGYADKSQYIPGTQYWMPGSDDYNILAGGSMPSPEDTTSWEERNNRVRYSFINDFLAAVEAKDDATISDMREIAGNLGALDGYDLDAMTNMDEDQIKTAFAYINGNNYQGFEDYMRKINYDLSRKSYEKWEEAEQLKAQGRNFWEHMGASITTWPQNVLASASGLTNDISAWLEKFGIDIRDPYLEHEFSNYNRWGADVDIIRGGADQYIRDNTWSLPENIPVVGGFNPLGTLYQGAMSLGDVGLARLAGDWLGGSLGLAGKAAKKFSQFVSGLHMFGIEVGRSLQEAMAAGQDNAALKATGDATLSAIFENIGLDKVLSGNLLKAAIGEGSEEFFTGATQMVWDALLNREDSKPAKLLDKYRIMGYASKAEFAAALDTAADLFEQFMSGFSAGGVGGVTPAVTNQVQNVKAGRTISANETQQPILDIAKSVLGDNPEIMKMIEQQQAALDATKASASDITVPTAEADGQALIKMAEQDGVGAENAEALDAEAEETTPAKKAKKVKTPKMSNAQMGRIFREAITKLDANAQKVLSDSFKTEVVQQLKTKGYQGDIQAAADAVVKMATGDAAQLTPEIMQAAITDKAVLDLVNEYTAPIRQRNELITLGAKGYQNPAKATTEAADEAEETPAESTIGGKAVKVTGLKSVGEDGTAMVEIVDADGNVREVDMEEVAFGAVDEGVAAMARMASNLGRNADTFLNNINEGQDQVEYAEAFETAMNFGRDGRNLDKTKSSEVLTSVLTPEQIDIAYNLGRNTRQQNARMVRKNASGISVGNVDTSGINMTTLNRSQRASVNAVGRLAKAIGFNVRFVESKANALGKYTTENGSWDARTMTMTLDVHAGSNYASDTNYAMMHTAGHELTHYIKDFADSGLWNEYQEFVIGHLSEKMDEAALEAKIQQHMRANPSLNRDGAIEEIVADASGDALMNISEAEIQQIAETNPGLFNKLKAFFEKWIGNLKKYIDAAYKGTEAKTAEAKAMHDVVDQLSEKWNKLLVNAAQNQKVDSEATNTQTEDGGEQALNYAHIDARTEDSVRNVDMDLFCKEVEQAQIGFAAAAEILLADVNNSTSGQKFFTGDGEVTGQKRQTSELIARMKDETGWTWDNIRKSLQQFADMDDASKGYPMPKNTLTNRRMELYLDEMLTEGYKTLDGTNITQWGEYVEAKAGYEGSKKAGMNYRSPANAIAFEDYAFADAGDVRYSVRDNRITVDSTEQERYEILKNASVMLAKVNAERAGKFGKNLDGVRKTEAVKAIKTIAATLGINEISLHNSTLDMDFDFSLKNIGKSASHQKEYGGSYSEFAKALSCIDQLAENAVPIEVHRDKKEGTKKANPDLKNVYVLVSAFADDYGYVPVQMEVKEFIDGNQGLYLNVALKKIEPGVGDKAMPGTKSSSAPYLLPDSEISIAEIFSNVNPDTDGRFLKYVPDGFLNAEQKAAKQRALAQQEAEYAGYGDAEKFSMRGSQTETAAFKNWFKGSKIVNEDGSPKVMYHGTPYGGFTVFKDWQYFTDNQGYADVYHEPSASSIRGRYNPATNPQTYAVYLSVKKPFDTRDPKIRKIWQEEFYNQYSRTPLSEKGLPDWTDGIDLVEFIEDNDYDFDAIILDEGAVGGYGDDVQSRGVSVVVRSSNQVKSATDNIGTFDPANPDILYQQRDLSDLSDRELLVEALQTELSPEERDHIERYSKKVEELNRKQMQLEALNEEIIRLRAKANDFESREELRKAETNAKTLRNSIANADKALSKIESAQMIREVIKRNRAEVRRKTAAQYKESYGKEKYRVRILEDAKRLYGWVVSPTNKGYVPEFLREPLAGFIESIDFTSARQLRGGDPTKNDAKFTEALEKLRRAIGEINKQQADIEGGATSFAGYIDLPADYMQEFDELVGKIKTTLDMSDNYTETPFARMKADQLHDLAKLFRILNSSISKVNRLVANGRYESAKTASNDTISDMNAMNAKVKTNKLLSSLNSMFNWKNTTPYYAFQRLGRGSKAIFEGLQDGWDKMAQNSAQLIRFAENAFTSKQAKEWSKDIKSIRLDSGDSFQITAAQAMSLYCLSKRQQAVGHLMGGGIRISDIDMGKGNTLSQVDNYVLSEADLLRIIGTLTAEQKSVADKLQNFMNTVCTDWGNEISMKRFGYKMFTEKFYFPIETDANNRSKIDDKQDGKTSLFRLLNMSAMKSLTPNANNAIIVRDIFDVFSNHASDIGKYNALALPILDFIKWYNYVEKVDVLDANGKATGKFTTKSTQKALERAYGTDAKQYVLSFIRDMNAEHDGGRNDTVLSKLMGQAKAGSVSANMRVAFLQITSLPRAAYAIDPKYLLKGMAKVKSLNPATAIKGSEAQQNVGILKWKNLGFYSTDVSRNTRSMVRRDENTISKIRDLVMKPAEWGDNWTSNIIYEAVKAEMAAKHPNVKPGTKAYDAMLNKRVREIVYKTQVVDSTMTRSDFMRSKGLMTAFTAFMSEPTLTVNMLNESIQEAVMNARTGMSARDNLRNVGGKAVRAATVMAFTATAAALVESLFDALRDDDDYEEFQEKFADAFGGNIVDNVNVFAMLPILKDAISVMQGYENSSMVTQVVSQYKDVQEAITAWQEGKRPIYSVIYNMLKVAASATGVGVQNATRDGVGLYNTFLADVFNTPKIQTYSDSKSKAAEEFYEALQAGDEEKVEWIMQRAEINGIALPDISDKIATLVKNEFVAGDITEEEATRRLIEYGGKDENEAYWKIQEWGYSGEGNFSKYTGLKDALKSGDRAAANAARDELAEHGASEQTISGQLSEIYNNGEATSILNLQMRSDSLYTSSLKLKADGEAHPDDFDAFITAIINGGNISGEIESLMDKGYTVKQCMSAINGAFGKSRDTYRIMEKYNSSDAGILLDRILDAYEYLGLDRAEEIAWIDANWIM